MQFLIVLLAVEDNTDEIFRADIVVTAGMSQNSSFPSGTPTACHRIWTPLERSKNTVRMYRSTARMAKEQVSYNW